MSMLLFGGKEYRERLYGSITKNTGLESPFLLWYRAFMSRADLSGDVNSCDIKHDIQEVMLLVKGKDPSKEWGFYTEDIDQMYDVVVEEFEKRGLIDYPVSRDGDNLPRLIGYNYRDDPQFFTAYRKKGEKSWNDRLPVPLNLSDVVRHVNAGYEFREKETVEQFLN